MHSFVKLTQCLTLVYNCWEMWSSGHKTESDHVYWEQGPNIHTLRWKNWLELAENQTCAMTLLEQGVCGNSTLVPTS